MKKRLLSILLALVIALSATMPAIAAESTQGDHAVEGAFFGAYAVESAFFLSLLTDEARLTFVAVDESFLVILVSSIVHQFRTGGYWTYAWSDSLSLEELLTELAEFLNQYPEEIVVIADTLVERGYWQRSEPGGLFDAFTFGADIVRDDVAAVFYAVVEVIYVWFGWLMPIENASNVSSDDLIDLIYARLTVPPSVNRNIERHMERHGDMWLVNYILSFFDYLYWQFAHHGDDTAIVAQQFLAIHIKIHQSIGITNMFLLLDHINNLSFSLGINIVDNALLNSPQRDYAITRLATYSQSELEQLMDFDFFHALTKFVQNDPPQGLIYIDSLLGGLLEENREYFTEMVEATQQREQAILERTLRMGEAFEEFIRFWSMPLPSREDIVANTWLEQRFTHHITSASSQVLWLFTIDGQHLNLHFTNNADTPVTITYFLV